MVTIMIGMQQISATIWIRHQILRIWVWIGVTSCTWVKRTIGSDRSNIFI